MAEILRLYRYAQTGSRWSVFPMYDDLSRMLPQEYENMEGRLDPDNRPEWLQTLVAMALLSNEVLHPEPMEEILRLGRFYDYYIVWYLSPGHGQHPVEFVTRKRVNNAVHVDLAAP